MGQVESMLDSFDEVDRKEVLNYDLTIRGVCNKIKSYDIRKIVVLAGAGLSTAAGIPDFRYFCVYLIFRTPGTGLYSNLQKYELPKPECMFDIEYFHENPEPFYTFANELLPGKYYPTLGHYFLCLLEKKGILQRVYTQNIDMLERLAGLNPEKLIECHGNFATSHCIKCHQKYDSKIVIDAIKEQKIAYCTNENCKGILKPGIIFFGESLPERFKWLTSTDMMSADLLIIIGTSLNVEPCASLVYQVGDLCPRMLINLEPVGPFKDYKNPKNYRDVFIQDSIDEAVLSFCKEMGWERDLMKIQQKKTKQLDYQYHPDRVPTAFQSFVNALKTLSPFSPRTDDEDYYNGLYGNDITSSELPYYNSRSNNHSNASSKPSSPLKMNRKERREGIDDNNNNNEMKKDESVRGASITSISSSVISTSPTEGNNNNYCYTTPKRTSNRTTETTPSTGKMPMYIQSVE